MHLHLGWRRENLPRPERIRQGRVGASLYVLVLALHEEGPCIGLEAQLPANPLGLVRELLRFVRFDVVAGVEDAVTASGDREGMALRTAIAMPRRKLNDPCTERRPTRQAVVIGTSTIDKSSRHFGKRRSPANAGLDGIGANRLGSVDAKLLAVLAERPS